MILLRSAIRYLVFLNAHTPNASGKLPLSAKSATQFVTSSIITEENAALCENDLCIYCSHEPWIQEMVTEIIYVSKSNPNRVITSVSPLSSFNYALFVHKVLRRHEGPFLIIIIPENLSVSYQAQFDNFEVGDLPASLTIIEDDVVNLKPGEAMILDIGKRTRRYAALP
jgi:hypothetical protein